MMVSAASWPTLAKTQGWGTHVSFMGKHNTHGKAGPPAHPQPHLGRDYGVPVGTPVFAPYAGDIGFAGNAGTFGNLVVISNSSWNIYLGHLSSISTATGDHVNAGNQVGLSGNTGHSTGPHLHFEQHTAGPIWQNGHAPRATAVEPCY